MNRKDVTPPEGTAFRGGTSDLIYRSFTAVP